MNQNILAKNKSFNQIENDIDDEEHGILAKTGSFLSSLLFKVTNAINPFKSKTYVQNPYDLNSSKDPVNHLNYVDTINNNNNLFISPSFSNYHSKNKICVIVIIHVLYIMAIITSRKILILCLKI